MPDFAPQLHTQAVGEECIHRVSFDGKLEEGETITGLPTAVEQTTTDLTISNVQISTEELQIFNRPVATGRAVLFKCVTSGATIGTRYDILVTASTSAGQVRNGIVRLTVN